MSTRLQQARKLCIFAHDFPHTRRNGTTAYFEHPFLVAEILSEYTDDEDSIIAAYLHDTIESVEEKVIPDKPEYSREQIGLDFSNNVRVLVSALTDEFTKPRYPLLNRRQRKQLERERYATMPAAAKNVKLADVIANLSDLQDTDAGFAGFYIREKAECLPYLKDGTIPALYKKCKEILDERVKQFILQ
jgi:(p)ppGpp synthase/HD superfamily hydrolase